MRDQLTAPSIRLARPTEQEHLLNVNYFRECSRTDSHSDFLVLSEDVRLGEGLPETQGEIDHPFLATDNLGATRESTQVVAMLELSCSRVTV